MRPFHRWERCQCGTNSRRDARRCRPAAPAGLSSRRPPAVDTPHPGLRLLHRRVLLHRLLEAPRPRLRGPSAARAGAARRCAGGPRRVDAAIRLLAFAATGATVFVTGLIVHRLGGGRTPQSWRGSPSASSPILLAIGSFYSMNAFEPLLWTLVAVAARPDCPGRRREALAAGGHLIGLAFENKHTDRDVRGGTGGRRACDAFPAAASDRWLWFGAAVGGGGGSQHRLAGAERVAVDRVLPDRSS